ncbi:MAG: hypothetical protein ABIS50_02690 [Luteolibacter sp.]|uniref:hypothetical protein n=1 Tax=Luteolibacter sp. TaxID=1962973 RepID=UPI003265D07E
MKSKFAILFSALTIAGGMHASAADVFLNFTGSSAFRSAAHATFKAMLGGATTEIAYYVANDNTPVSLDLATTSIFKGTSAAFPGDTVYVRCFWQGSGAGIVAVANQTNINLLTKANTLTTGNGTQVFDTPGTPTRLLETGKAQWAFSDVAKTLSTTPNATFDGQSGPIGVQPFIYLLGQNNSLAGATLYNRITNMTTQTHNALWSLGTLPASVFSGVATDTQTALACGRSSTSGTRLTSLSETKYGAFTNVQQYSAVVTGTFPNATLGAVSGPVNTGLSDNLAVHKLLVADGSTMTLGGSPVGSDAFFVGYVDATEGVAAVAEGAKMLSFNGVPYTVANVKNGSYTFWGYEQLYLVSGATAAQKSFDTSLRSGIVANLPTNAIAISAMAVTRSGGDGGPVLPLQ